MVPPQILRITGIAFCVLILPCHAVVDVNANGVSDVWEHKYKASSLVADAASKAADQDGDGQSNLAESEAGTNPWDKSSVHQVGTVQRTNTSVAFDLPAQKGKAYQIYVSDSLLTDSWEMLGDPIIATQQEISTIIADQSDDKKFYRIEVSDIDSDNDGVPDWDENQLVGFDAGNDDSFSSGNANNDLAAANAMMNSLNAGEITIAASTPDAFEKEATPAVFTITRTGDTTYPATLFLNFTGTSDTSKSSASPTDYELKNAGGSAIAGSITIPAGASSVELHCHPIADALMEVPEALTCQLGDSSQSATVHICDATNILENNRLYVAQLSPEMGAITSGSGLATILVKGDNTFGEVNMTFYGLSSDQTAAHIHIKNPVTGPAVRSIPRGQVNGLIWNIVAAQFIPTDQGMLDALHQGRIYINVHSSNYPAGEIRGDFSPETGSVTIDAPPAPPAIVTLTGDDLDRDIARFLTQSTFGPTPELMAELRNLVESAPHNGDRISAFGAWIDGQFAMDSPDLEPATYAADAHERFLRSIEGSPDYREDFGPGNNNRLTSWWLLATHSPDQLRQRAAFALSEIFVTSDNDGVVDQRHYGQANYYDMLKAGVTGSYRDLLEGVATHPIMGQYLSHLQNSKAIYDSSGNVIVSPDENFAREIMQLFSIGLVQLHADGSLKIDLQGLPIPTYAQDDISELSRVFTGWSFSKENSPDYTDNVITNTRFSLSNGSRYYQAQWTNRMANFAEYHDTGAKNAPILGLDIPAGGDGESDLDATIDFLSSHPNTAPFICRRLIQRLVTSNPSTGYIYRATQAWNSSNGNLGVVIKTILLDYEARSLDAATAITYGKKKEPIIQSVALFRALGAKSKLPLDHLDPSDTSIADLSQFAYSPTKLALFADQIAYFPAGTTLVRIRNTDSDLGQSPLAAPTVFNWFLPNFTIPGPLADAGMRAPEFQIADEISVIKHVNFNRRALYYSNGYGASSLPNQSATVSDTDPTPHPVYNPYGYGNRDDDLGVDFTPSSQLASAYMAVMDSNGDGLVNSSDAAFDDPLKIEEACIALVDYLDLLFCCGTLKTEYAGGYVPASVRPLNPRDIIIDSLTQNATYLDDNDDAYDQARAMRYRIQLAAYLVSTSPYCMVQK